jgi:hypothetical protein
MAHNGRHISGSGGHRHILILVLLFSLAGGSGSEGVTPLCVLRSVLHYAVSFYYCNVHV